MKFTSAYDSTAAPQLLFQLLKERDSRVNISHRAMPSWEEHCAFIRSRPYDHWYMIDVDDESVGAIYLTALGEIGVFILQDHRGQSYGKQAVEKLMNLHPRGRYLANINPENEESIAFFGELGFHHIQNTYEKR